MIVLSRHPIDVLRMSDYQILHSCHSKGRDEYKCAIEEAIGGGPIAYIVNKSELEKNVEENENINSIEEYINQTDEIFEDEDRQQEGITPKSRLRINRYYNKEDDYEIAIPRVTQFGEYMAGFYQTIKNFLKEKQQNIIEKYGLNEKVNFYDFVLTGGSYKEKGDGELFNEFFDEQIVPPDEQVKFEGPFIHKNEMIDNEISNILNNFSSDFVEFNAPFYIQDEQPIISPILTIEIEDIIINENDLNNIKNIVSNNLNKKLKEMHQDTEINYENENIIIKIFLKNINDPNDLNDLNDIIDILNKMENENEMELTVRNIIIDINEKIKSAQSKIPYEENNEIIENIENKLENIEIDESINEIQIYEGYITYIYGKYLIKNIDDYLSRILPILIRNKDDLKKEYINIIDPINKGKYFKELKIEINRNGNFIVKFKIDTLMNTKEIIEIIKKIIINVDEQHDSIEIKIKNNINEKIFEYYYRFALPTLLKEPDKFQIIKNEIGEENINEITNYFKDKIEERYNIYITYHIKEINEIEIRKNNKKQYYDEETKQYNDEILNLYEEQKNTLNMLKEIIEVNPIFKNVLQKYINNNIMKYEKETQNLIKDFFNELV